MAAIQTMVTGVARGERRNLKEAAVESLAESLPPDVNNIDKPADYCFLSALMPQCSTRPFNGRRTA
jgi:vacuolar-type H+-ATPase subunit E/Vma4